MFQGRYNRLIKPLFFFLELFLIVFFYFLTFNNVFHQLYFLLVAIIWIIPSFYFKSYSVPRTDSYIEALNPITSTLFVFIILFLIIVSVDNFTIDKLSTILIFLTFIILSQYIFSFIRFNFFHNYRLNGKNFRNVLLIDSTINNDKLDNLKKDGLHFGYYFKSHISSKVNIIKEIEDKLLTNNYDFIFLYDANDSLQQKIIEICESKGIRLKLLIDINKTFSFKNRLDIISGRAIIDLNKEPLLFLGNRILKRLLDIFIAIISILFILSWLPLVVKIAQIIFYPGKLFFIQDRIGQDGKVFKLFKFRTMYESQDSLKATKGLSNKTKINDHRIPKFGSLLRRTNLDEYPQFINVLFGTMSTVGPRPHMTGEDEELQQLIPRYRMRRFVKPGITGLAAINGYRGGTENMELMTKRIDFDIHYLENWSFFLDFKIVFITVLQMITFRIPKAY